VAFSTDESYLFASAANQVLVYQVSDGKLLHSLKGHKEPVTSVTALVNGGLASGGADKTVIIWSQKFEGVLKYTHSFTIQALEQDPLSGILVSCTAGDFGLWSADKKAVNKTKV
jgi:intraflagellar transport protein 122